MIVEFDTGKGAGKAARGRPLRGAPVGQPRPRRRPSQPCPPPPPSPPPPRWRSRPGQAAAPAPEGERPLASPAVRRRAEDLGVKLSYVAGTGPAGRITHEDLDAFVSSGGRSRRRRAASPASAYARREAWTR